MTSGHDSSGGVSGQRSVSGVESLAGAFHPHAIGVQDFFYYALIIDVRGTGDYRRDHIPGAVRMEPGSRRDRASAALVSRELTRLLRGCERDAACLVYCGRGGLDSQPVAAALHAMGHVVDVIPGGWANYRRWVRAGLDLLPRLLMFRTIDATPAATSRRQLSKGTRNGLQVLDLQALAAQAKAFRRRAPQMWFESLLIQALRRLEPARSVWVKSTDFEHAGLQLPRALGEGLGAAFSS